MLFPKYIVLQDATSAQQLHSLIARQDYGLLRTYLVQTFGTQPDEIDQSPLLISPVSKASECIILRITAWNHIELLSGTNDSIRPFGYILVSDPSLAIWLLNESVPCVMPMP